MKKFILLPILLILLSSFASAGLFDELYDWWNFDNNLHGYLGNDGTNFGATNIPSGCLVNGCFDFEASEDDYVTLTEPDYSGNFSFTWSENRESLTNYDYCVGHDYAGVSPFEFAYNNGKMEGWGSSGGAGWDLFTDEVLGSVNVKVGVWATWGFRFNGTAYDFFKNGTKIHTVASTSNPRDRNVDLVIGTAQQRTIKDCDGLIDEVLFTNEAWTDEQFNLSYQCMLDNISQSACGVVPPQNYTSINITDSEPIDLSSFNNFPINFNLTGNFTYDTNCSLVINSTINITRLHQILRYLLMILFFF